ncbi:EAL domain-containing protein [Paucibacter sp. JuS9]|uniref:GGDEF/EAL domain-containing response regulator n=1 Tax=Paucibacter sp. JuS9 TaxID=3228748 RepID=UPI00375690E1
MIEASTSTSTSRSARILIVDDTPANLEVISGLLQPLGHELSTATSGERALQIVERLLPDLILLDIMMPGIDGLETCRRLKSNPMTAGIPVIFVTGAGDNVDAGFAVGGVDYLVKPVREAELGARVMAHLKLGWLVRELAEKNAGLEEARQELERRVLERTRELSVANRNLRLEVNERRQAEDRLNFLARHDFLTRLLNRPAFEDAFAHLLSSRAGLPHCLLYLDLDQFKVVNDVCGHVAGDELLREVAELIRGLLGPGDLLARLGGDEFAALLVGVSIEQGKRQADQIRRAIEEYRFVWEQHTFGVAASVGLAAVKGDETSVDALLGRVDAACFAAKEEGRNRVHVYDEQVGDLQTRQAQMQLAPRLTQALEQDRFVLYRQRIKPLQVNEEGEHFEVLLRMRDEQGGLVQPHGFIPAAERFGLMAQIDRWVLRRLSWHYRRHPEQLQSLALCSVNLSGLSLGDPMFEEFVERLLEEGHLPPPKLCFEITETVAVTNLPRTLRFIHKFRRLGLRFALDDFGSGVSSYAYLKSLPVDFLKIDGVFVKDMVSDPVDRAMVRSINEIGQVMGRRTIAEYAENGAIIALLTDLGVDFAQGYGLEQPQPFIY